MSLPKETACTIEDIYALPDGQRAELIDGQMYMMAPPLCRRPRILGCKSDKKDDQCLRL